MSYRKATAEDAADMSRINAKSWKSAYRGIVPDEYLDTLEENHWEEYFSGLLAREEVQGQKAYVLSHVGEALGSIVYGPARDEDKAEQGWAEIVACYLDPAYFDKGIGGQMLTPALEDLKEKGFEKVFAWVLEGNSRGRRFYEKHGFAPAEDTLQLEVGGRIVRALRYEKTLADAAGKAPGAEL